MIITPIFLISIKYNESKSNNKIYHININNNQYLLSIL